jgi:hypothetical protein
MKESVERRLILSNIGGIIVLFLTNPGKPFGSQPGHTITCCTKPTPMWILLLSASLALVFEAFRHRKDLDRFLDEKNPSEK